MKFFLTNITSYSVREDISKVADLRSQSISLKLVPPYGSLQPFQKLSFLNFQSNDQAA